MAKRTQQKKNLKFVVDTNVFIISLTSFSPYHSIYEKLVNGDFDLLVNIEILLEYEEIICLKYGKKTASYFLSLLSELPNVLDVTSYFNWGLIEADKDDNKYVDCAIAGQADYIVSEDSHFNILATVPFPKVSVIDIEKFRMILQKK